METVKTLMHRGLPVDSGDYDFRTTLHLAAVEGNLKAGAYTRPLSRQVEPFMTQITP